MGLLGKLFGRHAASAPAPSASAGTQAHADADAGPSRFDPAEGDRLLAAGQLDEAEAYFRRHLAGHARAHHGLGLVLARRDTATLTPERIAASAQHFLDAVALDPGFAEAHLLCGTMQCALAAKALAAHEREPAVATRLDDAQGLLASAGMHLQRAAELDAGLTRMAVVQARRLKQLAATAQRLRGGRAG